MVVWPGGGLQWLPARELAPGMIGGGGWSSGGGSSGGGGFSGGGGSSGGYSEPKRPAKGGGGASKGFDKPLDDEIPF